MYSTFFHNNKEICEKNVYVINYILNKYTTNIFTLTKLIMCNF